MATQDHKPLMHMTRMDMARIYGYPVEVLPSRLALTTACGQNTIVALTVGLIDLNFGANGWKNVTCPECIIAMDSDE